jgi:cytochrome c oxidase subunit 2
MRGDKPSLTAIGLVGFYVILIVVIVVGFAAFQWRPELASTTGAGIDAVLTYLLYVTGVIVIVGHGFLGYFVWRYSHRGEGPRNYGRPSKKMEWIWALLPVFAMSILAEVGVLVIGSPVWAEIYIEEAENPVLVRVVGKQFEWLSHYPGPDGEWGRTRPDLVHDKRNPIGLDEDDPAAKDDIVKRGTLTIPVDRDIVLDLRTQDVLHSFFVPQFRVKQDLISGFNTSLKFHPNKTGKYEIACAELCGLGHYTMRGFCIVKEPDDFEKWLSEEEAWFGD